MKILQERIGSGTTIKGEAVMLSRSGIVYNVIDNLMHPNPGTADDDYSEIERTVDWLIGINKGVRLCEEWIDIKVAQWLNENPDDDFDEVVLNIMYSDLYDPNSNTIKLIGISYGLYKEHPELISKFAKKDDIEAAGNIANYLNENFLRIRAGGKLNPQGSNAIYFRISSHGFDWHRNIVDFLWDTFEDPKNMPERIWIGTDAETNPPERSYFDGTPQDLFDKFDEKKFESYKNKKAELLKLNINECRIAYRLNKLFKESMYDKEKYKSFM